VLLDILARFMERLGRPPERIIIACSGGRDSTALLHAMAQLQRDGRLQSDLAAVHVNHQLRGEDSMSDQEQVVRHCASLNVELVVLDGLLDPEVVRARGVEAAAREIRYRRYAEVLRLEHHDLLATAHQRDDQLETILMRFITGSGTSRLRGIRPLAGSIIRPMLEAGGNAIDQFISEWNLSYRHDETNRQERFLRNRIRLRLLPLLRELNPQADQAILETARQIGEEEAEIEQLITLAFGGAIRRDPVRSELSLPLFDSYPALMRRVIASEIQRLEPGGRSVGAERLRQIMQESTPRTDLSARLELIRSRQSWIIARREEHIPLPIPVRSVTVGEIVRLPEAGVRLLVEKVESVDAPPGSATHQFFSIPGNRSDPKLAVRSRRPGDRFHPLGAPGEKKLKDFLIDRKIDQARRDTIPLLICDDEIVWVAGVEISERFKVGETGTLFKATIEKEVLDEEGLQR
jgi:tRNA(Ile)-lysidine synthase